MTRQPMLEIQNVVKSFGATRVVDGISFDVHAGECVALLGPSGCGKTTTLRMLAGFEQPDAGAIVMGGRDVVRLKPYERNVGLVFQDYALFPHMSVAENIDYGMRRRGLSRADIAARRAELVDLVRLHGLEQRRPAQLSGGQQQRVAIARALAPRPSLLLLDEPLSNLDTRLRLALRQSLRSILSVAGVTTLIVTHDQEEAMAMADRIVVLDKGRVQQFATPAELYAFPANRFVAEFMGPCLFLPVEREGQGEDGVVTARLGDGSVLRALAPPHRLLPSAGLGVVIRPEQLQLHPPDRPVAPGTNRLRARLLSRDFLGAAEELTLRLASGAEIVVRSSAGPATMAVGAVGTDIALDVQPSACLLVPEQTT